MKTKNFKIGQTYTKGQNEYQFRGMNGNNYHFWIKNNGIWENIMILPSMTDILDNLK